MFNLLVSYDTTSWEGSGRFSCSSERFKEYSGDEASAISLDQPESLKLLESVLSILMYEKDAPGVTVPKVRVGSLYDIQVESKYLTFRFRLMGELSQYQILDNAERLQLGKWEATRTHWSIKDGAIPQDLLQILTESEQPYDVVLSFAGENRSYVEAVAAALGKHGVRYFYDHNETASLWGKDLVEHFDLVYKKLGRYCVMFISRAYAEKAWTTHERRSALERALNERREYILPARFDDVEIPGLRGTVFYVELANYKPEELARLIREKLGRKP